ncbi:MAG: PQQ-dependent sugar dehydrogenase [Actinobacteria bacterium]|nr:PQQ-dependent sugar dehydrogenase [Actinomycetota bacterium]
MRGGTTGVRAVKVCLLALVLSVTVLPEGSVLLPSVANALPPGFQVNTVISGLDTPTAVAFSPDGRVFVAEKSGIIKVYTDLNDPTPTTFADLSTNVYNFFDRGLLGLELHPNFPAQPYVYALYTYDGDIGEAAPKWGTPGVLSDPCPDPPGASPDGCPAAARLSRLTASGDVMSGPEQVLIEDWCQQSPTHSIGTVTFGPDGALYVGAGEAASPLDWGQYGDPVDNPCGDPPGGVGGAMSPPTAEGGALRSQDLRTTSDPTTLDGTIIRVDPLTGAALPDNPLFGSSDPNARRVIAYGLRNPFRFAFRPGTNEIWAGDVGQATWEEINRILSPTDAVVENFGWPCYEGSPRMPGWDTRDFTICENLYNEPRPPRRRPPTSRIGTASPSSRVTRARPAAAWSAPSVSTRAGPIPTRTTARCSSRTTDAAASGRCRRARTAFPTRTWPRCSSTSPASRSTSRPGRPATSSTSTSASAGSGGSSTSRATSRRPP